MEISKIYEENGYIITEYDNGTIEKSLKSDENVIIKKKTSKNQNFFFKPLIRGL